MNSTESTFGGSGGNWIAFVFGATFSVLGEVGTGFLLDYTLKALIGGGVCLLFKMLGDVLSPFWQRNKKHIDRIRRTVYRKRPRE
jgi:hypothetical protein